MKTFKNKLDFVYFMKNKLFIITYFLFFILLFSLIFVNTDLLRTLNLISIILIAYILYKLTKKNELSASLIDFNHLFIATAFIFAIYVAGFKGNSYYDIWFGLIILTSVAIVLYVLEDTKKSKLIAPKKPSINLDQIIKEAKAMEEIEKKFKEELKQEEIKKIVPKKKKVAKKKTTTKSKKSTIKKKTAKKKTSKR